MANRAIRKAHQIVTVSHSVAAEIHAAFGREAAVVSNVVDLDTSESIRPEGFDRPFFLSVGSIEPRKNLRRLAEGFRAARLLRNFDLVLVGRAAWGHLPAGVKFTGPMSDANLRWLYEHACALVAGSVYEGFGLPVAEAVSLGTPVYCSDIPAFHEASQGKARLFFNPESTESIREAFLQAADESFQVDAESRSAACFNAFTCSRMMQEFCAVCGIDGPERNIRL